MNLLQHGARIRKNTSGKKSPVNESDGEQLKIGDRIRVLRGLYKGNTGKITQKVGDRISVDRGEALGPKRFFQTYVQQVVIDRSWNYARSAWALHGDPKVDVRRKSAADERKADLIRHPGGV